MDTERKPKRGDQPKKILVFACKLYGAGLILFAIRYLLIEKKYQMNGKIDEVCTDSQHINYTNQKIYPKLDRLSHTKFFRTFFVNIEAECPLGFQDSICASEQCGVCVCGPEDVPPVWRQEKTDLIDNKIITPNWQEEKDDWDWRVEEFERYNGVFVDLKMNMEAFTGYQGQHIWELIYQENCFTGKQVADMCVEERALNKMLSGLHSSVSTQLSELYIDLERNQTQMFPNYNLWFNKVGNHPQRIQNLYFYYAILLRAINKAAPFIKNYQIDTGDYTEDQSTKILLHDILDFTTETCTSPFEEKQLFNSIESCEKCKVFGQMQIYGIGVAMKILFSNNTEHFLHRLQRNQLIGLVNAFVKSASSLHSIDLMFQRRAKGFQNLMLAIFAPFGFFLVFCYFCLRIYISLEDKVRRMFQNMPQVDDPMGNYNKRKFE